MLKNGKSRAVVDKGILPVSTETCLKDEYNSVFDEMGTAAFQKLLGLRDVLDRSQKELYGRRYRYQTKT